MENSFSILASKLVKSGKFNHLGNSSDIEKAVLLETTVEYVELLERELKQYKNSATLSSNCSCRPVAFTSTPLGGRAVAFQVDHYWQNFNFPSPAQPPYRVPHIQNCQSIKIPPTEQPLDLSRSFSSTFNSDLSSSVTSSHSLASTHETISMKSETDSSGYHTNSLGSSLSSEWSENDNSTEISRRMRDGVPKKRLIFDVHDLDGPGQSDSESLSTIENQNPRERFQKGKSNFSIWRPYGYCHIFLFMINVDNCKSYLLKLMIITYNLIIINLLN